MSDFRSQPNSETAPAERRGTYTLIKVTELAALKSRIQELEAALEVIEGAPFSMVNDSESLRHTIRGLQAAARAALQPKRIAK